MRILMGRILVISSIVTLVTSCASIAFFPAQPAQVAVDQVIDEVWPTTRQSIPAAESKAPTSKGRNP